MSIKPRLLTVAAAALLVGLTGCGSSATTSSPAASQTDSTPSSSPKASDPPAPSAAPNSSAPKAAPVLITIKDFKYTVPASVSAGAKITIKNEDGQNHTVTSSPKGAFNVKVDGGGGMATFTAPTKPGSYMFLCEFHADMMGTLVVT